MNDQRNIKTFYFLLSSRNFSLFLPPRHGNVRTTTSISDGSELKAQHIILSTLNVIKENEFIPGQNR